MEKVSIIIPVYNMENYLRQCLDSVVGQTYPNVEVLIIDDGSTDLSSLICDEYDEKFDFVTVYHKINEGLCSARNLGLKKASGDWILFVDSDDWCSKDYVQNLMSGKGMRDGVDVILSSVYEQRRNGEFFVNYYTYLSEGYYDDPDEMKMLQALSIGNFMYWKRKWSEHLAPRGNNGAVWDMLYNRKIIEENHVVFEEETKVYEDMLFNMRYFSYVNNAVYVDAKGYYYRFNDSGITKKIDKNRLQKERYFFEQVEEFSKLQTDNPYFEDAKKMRVSILMRRLVKWVAYAGHFMKMSQIKKEVHSYLHQLMIYKALQSIKLGELNNVYTQIAIILARYEMVGGMYILGNIALLFRKDK